MVTTVEEYLVKLGKTVEDLKKEVVPIHATHEFPMISGTTDQAENLLGVIGEYKSARDGIKGKTYDDVRDFFYGDPIVNRIHTGRDLFDLTPVGYVTHPAPVGVTSVFYWTPLVVQAIEGGFELANPEPKTTKTTEADKKFEEWLGGLQNRAINKYSTILGLKKSELELKIIEKKLEEAKETIGTVGEPLSYAQFRDIAKLGGDIYIISGEKNYFKYLKNWNDKRKKG